MDKAIAFLLMLCWAAPAWAAPKETRIIVSPVCGDGSDDAPRRPCLVDRDMSWVLLHDGGTEMVVKVLAEPSIFVRFQAKDVKGETTRDARTKLSPAARASLDQFGEGTVLGR